MRCEEAQGQIPLYAAGALDARQRARLESHLSRCPQCTSEVDKALTATSLLASELAEQEPSMLLKRRLLRKLPAQPWRRVSASQWEPSHRWQLAGAAVLGALLVALLAAILMLNARIGDVGEQNKKLSTLVDQRLRALEAETREVTSVISQRLTAVEAESQMLPTLAKAQTQLSQVVQQQRSLVYMLATPGVQVTLVQGSPAAPAAHGMLLTPTGGSAAFLVVVGLERLPDDKTYQVWLTKDTQRVKAGAFNVDDTGWGQARIEAGSPIVWFPFLVVTIEPTHGPPWPTGPRVLGATVSPP
ncbi:MAG: anti-sigma factor [Chloroflexi bacterium]|nr:anti-sigma factor [Chloroflexota bacterium]